MLIHMAIPLEPPAGDYRQLSITSLPSGDVVISRNGLQTQYQKAWLMNQSSSVLAAIFKGLEHTPIGHSVLLSKAASIPHVDNPFAKTPKTVPPKPVVHVITTTSGTTPYSSPTFTGTTAQHTWSASELVIYPPMDLDLVEDSTPQIEAPSIPLKERLAPKRVVEID